MFKKTIYAALVMLSLAFARVENGLAQSVFRLGAWCFRTGALPEPIYEQSPGVWRVRGPERDRLLNIGFNYFVACTGINGTETEQAIIFMGDSLAAASSPKEFETTLAWSPANPSSATAYQVWDTINQPGGPGNPVWEARVNNGYISMNALHAGHAGLHSFFSGAERNLHLTAYHQWAEYISNAVHVNAPGVQALVQTCPFAPGILNSLLSTVASLDIFMHCNYPFPTGTPTSGGTFQNALQSSASQFSEATTAVKTYQPATPFYAIIQAHRAQGTFNYRAPSLQEILCQINLALAYGAKGIVYYLYVRVGSPTDFQEGLLDVNRNPTAQYTSVQTIHNNYQSTGQKLVDIGTNFLNLTWQAGFSIHQNTQEPISASASLHDVQAKPSGGSWDLEPETYVEVGHFKDSNNLDYLMVVNRRCTISETREITVT